MERLQKYLARSGVASRRKAEEMIEQGLIKVNGKIITEMGFTVYPEKDRIQVRDKIVKPEERKIYILMNKPTQVVTTVDDPQGRTKVVDLLKGIKERVYPVGRLDYNSEGLLLLTNDGNLAYFLTHPRFKVEKTYIARVKGAISEKAVKELINGVLLEDGPTQPAVVKVLKREDTATLLEITIREGRNRQVRRMCEKVGHDVVYLKRIRFGTLTLGDMKSGQYRYLNEKEVQDIKKLLKHN
jgi:pseudouridine synthase